MQDMMAEWKWATVQDGDNQPPQHTHTDMLTRICTNRLIQNIPRNLVIHNITALIIKTQCRGQGPGAESMPSSMRADGMYNFMTDARIHTEMQGHFNIHRKKKERKKITTRSRKRMRVHLLTGQSGRTRDVCTLIAAYSQNANLALQMCASLNSHTAMPLFKKSGVLWI